MNWISSTGGPSIIISNKSKENWSGVATYKSIKEGEFIEAEDFLDPSQCHYGRACTIEDYLGIIDFSEGEKVIVIGDEPSSITILMDADTLYIIKWYSGESKESFEQYINLKNFEQVKWNLELNVELNLRDYVLMDASAVGLDLEGEEMIHFHMKKGNYLVYTGVYDPDEKTRMILHKLAPQ